MKSIKGFTLVELLAVIVIIAILVIITMTSVSGISKKIQTNMFCTKIKTIEHTAVLWGEDNYNDLQKVNAGQNHEAVNCAANPGSCIKIQNLVDESYVKKDDLSNGNVVDPRDKSSMNTIEIKLFIKNNRVYAKVPSADAICNQ